MRKTSRRLPALLLALAVAWSLLVPALAAGMDGAAAADGGKTAMAAEVYQVLSDTLAQERKQLSKPTYGSEWVVLGLARSAPQDKGSRYFAEYYARLAGTVAEKAAAAEKLNAPSGALHLVKCTENSRVILTLAALGRDVRNVGGWDLTAPYRNTDWVIAQGLNSPIWALIALDAADFEEEGQTAAGQEDGLRQTFIRHILRRQLPDGGWDFNETSVTADPDMTAMAVQALSRYGEQADVKEALGRAVTCLSAIQNTDGGFSSYNAANSESTAQVIVACAALGIDPHSDPRFVKNGSSAVDALLTFYDAQEKAFRHVAADRDGKLTGVDAIATEQAAYAMVAYLRLVDGKPFLYDMRDVTEDCADGRHTFGPWQETPATCTEAGCKSRTCTVCGRSEVVETAAALGHKTGGDYEMSDAAHWFPCTVCGAHLEETAHQYACDQCRVCGYHKLGGRLTITTLTAVPEALRSISGMDSVAGLRKKMLEAAKKVDGDVTAANAVLLEAALMTPSAGADGKTVWTQAGRESFPDTGKITIVLPYPAGTNRSDYEFVVVHTIAAAGFSKKAGSMESPQVKKTADGLQVTTTGLSPVMIAWTSGTDTVAEKLVRSARTGDTSQMALWVCGVVVPAAAVTLLVQKRKRGAK